jgi:hypothetical protein
LAESNLRRISTTVLVTAFEALIENVFVLKRSQGCQ